MYAIDKYQRTRSALFTSSKPARLSPLGNPSRCRWCSCTVWRFPRTSGMPSLPMSPVPDARSPLICGDTVIPHRRRTALCARLLCSGCFGGTGWAGTRSSGDRRRQFRCLYCPRYSSQRTAPHRAVDPGRPTWRLYQGAWRGARGTHRPLPEGLETEDWRAAVETSFNEALTGSTAQTRDRVLAWLAATPQDCLSGMSRGMFAFEAVDALDRYLAAPGTRAHAIIATSNTFPFSLHILRPTLTTTTIPDTGHWLMLDAPEAPLLGNWIFVWEKNRYE